MRQILLAGLVLVLVVSFTNGSIAQGKISFGIGADVALPISSGFSDTQGIGIGGTAKGYYKVDPMTTLTATAGYITFAGKDYTVGGVTVSAGTWSMIPVVVGGRYYFAPESESLRFYGGVDLGLIFSSYTVKQPAVIFGGITIVPASEATFTGSDFTYQPMIGFEASNWDVAVRYLGVSGAGSVAARIGYIFN